MNSAGWLGLMTLLGGRSGLLGVEVRLWLRGRCKLWWDLARLWWDWPKLC